jgi:hypothetical protein
LRCFISSREVRGELVKLERSVFQRNAQMAVVDHYRTQFEFQAYSKLFAFFGYLLGEAGNSRAEFKMNANSEVT